MRAELRSLLPPFPSPPSSQVAMLSVNDAAMQKLMLEALGSLLGAGELLGASKGVNPFLVPFDEAEGIDKLETLQVHARLWRVIAA